MPEIPDLLYVKNYPDTHVTGHTTREAEVRQPVVIRMMVEGSFADIVNRRNISKIRLRGPFLHVLLSTDLELIINLVLAGRIRHLHARALHRLAERRLPIASLTDSMYL
jgi:formamidopyrimidine-DNA glycosylase